jgi:hypothetical protein
MFEQLRESLRGFSDRLSPEDQRHATASMRDALVHAKLAVSEMRDAVRATEARLATERTTLETVRRRQGYAAQIEDAETVAIAERFAAQHAERVAVLESKVMVQQQELALAEREYDDMSAQLRMAMSGFAPTSGGVSPEAAAKREVDALLSDDPSAAGTAASGTSATENAANPVRRTRAEKEADAESRLAELKRRMGK